MPKLSLVGLSGQGIKTAKAQYMREYRKDNPEIFKRIDLKKNFGISLEYYYKLLDEQGNVCAICEQPETAIDSKRGVPFSLAVDHKHETGVVRGLLCMKCNRAIGMLNDDTEILKKAIKYLERNA